MTGRRLVLVGAGHAHLHAITRTAELARRGIHVTVVSPGPFVYSGITAAILGGRFEPGSATIRTSEYVRAAGGEAIDAEVETVDVDRAVVRTTDGREVPWDAVSVDVGSTASERIPGASEYAYGVKPFAQIEALAADLDARLERSSAFSIVCMGGGASAVEVAGNLDARMRRAGRVPDIRLVMAGARLLEDLPASAGARIAAHFTERGIRVHTGVTVAGVTSGELHTTAGSSEADILVDATGLVPVPLAVRSGLPDVGGALLVDRFLRSLADPRVFGGGDSIRVAGREDVRPIGVHAVRQGPVLLHNLLATLEGRAPRPYRHASGHLAILDVGAGQALAVRNGLAWLGRGALLLKDAIDLRFLRRHGGVPVRRA